MRKNFASLPIQAGKSALILNGLPKKEGIFHPGDHSQFMTHSPCLIPDATGYADELQAHQLDSLNAAAQRLTDALPADFQSDFAVYDLGFYRHHTSYEGGIPDIMQEAIDSLSTSYYLIFGREIGEEGELKKVWVEMELPSTEDFCFWEDGTYSHLKFMVELRANAAKDYSGSVNSAIFTAMKEAMEYMEGRVAQLVDCCSSSARQSCECGWSFGDIRDFMKLNGFYEFNSEVAPSLAVDTNCVCFDMVNPVEYQLEEDSLEVYSFTTLSEITFEPGINISLSELQEMFRKLGELYRADGKTFFAAITDHYFYCGENESSPPSFRTTGQKYGLDDIFTKIQGNSIGIWYNIYGSNGEAQIGIYSKGIESEGVGWASKFSGEFGVGQDTVEYIQFTLDLVEAQPIYKYSRFSDFFRNFEDEIIGGISSCMTPVMEEDYADLLNFQMPQEGFDRLDSLGDGFTYQTIDNATSTLVNLDYYGVEITQLPNFVNNPSSPASELIEAIRENFPELSKGSAPLNSSCLVIPTVDVSWEFKGYNHSGINLGMDLWHSSDPLSHIFFIEAGASGGPIYGTSGFLMDVFATNHGAVMVSQFDPCCWIFTTIQTPASKTQPFSGHRQFGIRLNDNGNYEFYTRAIDKVLLPKISLERILYRYLFINCPEKDYFTISELTWSNLQKDLVKFIKDHGGWGEIVPKKVLHIDFENFKQKFKSSYPVKFVSCD